MTNFLPNVSRFLMPGKITLCILALAGGVGAQAQADLQISNLSLTPGNEQQFDFSYTVTNAGTQPVTSYAMKLTFSSDQTLDPLDYFSIELEGDAASQMIGAGLSGTKIGHVQTTAVNKLLPSGTWYVIAEVNFDHVVAETNYDNNQVVSGSALTVSPYTAQFLSVPTVSAVTNESFVVGYVADDHIFRCYYRYQFEGMPAPGVSEMQSSAEMSPDVPVTIHYLSPAQAYDVYFMGQARDGNATDIYKVQTTTTGFNSPSVVTTLGQISMFPVGVGTASSMNLVGIFGHHLSAPVVVTTSQGFVASLDDVTYASVVTIPASGFDGGAQQNVFLKSQPFDTRGYKSGTCTFSTTGAADQLINLGVVVYSGYTTDFEDASSMEETGWLTYNVSGDQVWSLADLDYTATIQIDGAGSTAENEDWLISPEVDLTTFTQTPALRFRAYNSGTGEPLVLKYSADYPGYGDPRNSTWISTDASLLSANSKTWKNIMVKLLAQEAHLRFAFIYSSDEQQTSRWAIDDWRITDNAVNIPDNELLFDNVSVGMPSEPRNMLVSVVGFGSVTISASEEFQVSSDGIVFSPAVVIPEADVATGVTLRVRYFPRKFTAEKQGSLTFTANGGFSVVKNILTGRVGLTTGIEDRSIQAGILYPNPTSGEVHVDLSSLPDTEASYPVMVANSIGVSVAVINGPAYTIENSLSNIFTNLEPGVYFVIIKGRTNTWRTKLIRK